MSERIQIKVGDTRYTFRAIFKPFNTVPRVGVTDDNVIDPLPITELTKEKTILKDGEPYDELLRFKLPDFGTTYSIFSTDDGIEIYTNLDKYKLNINNGLPQDINIGDMVIRLPKELVLKDTVTIDDIRVDITAVKSLSTVQNGSRYGEVMIGNRNYGSLRFNLINNLIIKTSVLECNVPVNVQIDGSNEQFVLNSITDVDEISVPIG